MFWIVGNLRTNFGNAILVQIATQSASTNTNIIEKKKKKKKKPQQRIGFPLRRNVWL